MTKTLIALGLTLAASTAAFAQPDFNHDRLPGASYGTEYRAAGDIDYTATASVGTGASAQADFNYDQLPGASHGTEYRAAGDVDYTATASIGTGSEAAIDEANNELNYSR